MPISNIPTKDGSIMIGAANDRLYGLMCRLLNKEEWIVEESALRVKHRRDLVRMIVEETKKKTTAEWLDLFEGSGIPYAAINDIQATLNHPHVLARNMIAVVEHPTCGPLKLVNTPIKYSATKPTIRDAPPTLGQHTDEILKKLGYSGKEIDILRVEQVIG
ncbi:CoA-transferase family III domain-containing protein [Lipomyces mesembrius]